MELIYIVSGGFACSTVDGHTVPDRILDNQHSQLFKLFPQILDIKADDTVFQFHIGPVVEYF